MAQDLEARVRELELQVGELRETEALRSLRLRYHECINEGRYDELSSMFCEDAEVDFGYLGGAQGRERIHKLFSDQLFSEAGFVKQFVHNHVVRVEGDLATGFCYLEAKTVTRGEPYVVAARYDDTYRREGGEWRFTSMRLTPFFAVPLHEGWAGAATLKMQR